MASSERVSEQGVSVGADPTPFLVYGHGSEQLAKQIAAHSTLCCTALENLSDLRTVLEARPCVGITAMSRPDAPGEAGVAIGLFRDAYRDTEVATYGAWDYNVHRAAERAIEYRADGIIMPGITAVTSFVAS